MATVGSTEWFMTADVSEINKLVQDLDEAMKELPTYLQQQMAKAVFLVEAEAKLRSTDRPGPRVDTGRHRASIHGAVKSIGTNVQGIVGAGAIYSPYLEHGTRKMPPYPYLHPAVEAKMDEIERLLGEVLDKVVLRIVEG